MSGDNGVEVVAANSQELIEPENEIAGARDRRAMPEFG